MTTTNLSVTWATWVSQSAPTAVYFNKTGYLSMNATVGSVKYGYLYFTNPFPNGGVNVQSATLTLKTRSISGTGTINLGVELSQKYPVSISAMNFNNRATGNGSKVMLTKSAPLGNDVAWTFDVTSLMQHVSDGFAFQGFVVSTTNTRDVNIEGNMSAALNPTLSVTYTTSPFAPQNLAPSTGAAVGTQKPILTWTYVDHVSGESLGQCQVQTASSETGFGTPVWDSGQVSTTVSQLDLSSGSYTAVAADTAVWWRVRCADTSGLWSPWSDPASFQFHGLPSVTLSQPNGTGFTDPTPPIVWSYSGDMPQTRYRVGVYELINSAWKLIDSVDSLTAESTWTPDAGLAQAGQVRIVVDVFDGRQREAVSGVPIYGTVLGEFAFAPSATVAPPAGIVVTPDPVLPLVQLDWTRTETPDRWDVYRDGVKFTSHAGTDFLVSGDAYRCTDGACAGGLHTWDIYAIVNGKSSLSGSVTFTVDRPGTWLMDQETSERVWIQGESAHALTMPEDTATFTPMGSQSSIVVTSGQRGYEDTCSGILVDEPYLPSTDTAAVYRQTMLKWKADPGHSLWMLTEGMSFPVGISEVTIADMHPWLDRFQVSFKWHQTGNFAFKAA